MSSPCRRRHASARVLEIHHLLGEIVLAVDGEPSTVTAHLEHAPSARAGDRCTVCIEGDTLVSVRVVDPRS